MKLFIQCNRGGKQNFVAYEGQSEDTVRALLTDLGATDVTVITEETYTAAQKPPAQY